MDRTGNDRTGQFDVAPAANNVHEARLRWYGHVLADGDTFRKIGLIIGVPRKRPKDRLEQRYGDTFHMDLKAGGVR